MDLVVADSLIMSHLRMARTIARKHERRDGVDDGEFFGAAYIGLRRAAERYDPAQGRFSTCAWKFIEGAIRDQKRRDLKRRPHQRLPIDHGARVESIARHDDVDLVEWSDLLASVAQHLERRERMIVAMLAEGLTHAEIGQACGVTESRITQIVASLRPVIAAHLRKEP